MYSWKSKFPPALENTCEGVYMMSSEPDKILSSLPLPGD